MPSKYGGIPVEDEKPKVGGSKYGGIPVEDVSPTTPKAPAQEGFWSSVGSQLNPMPALRSAYDTVTAPDALPRIGRAIVNAVTGPAREHGPKALTALKGGLPGTALDETLRSIPLVGPAAGNFADTVSDQIKQGNYRGALGTTVGFGIPIATGGLVSEGLGRMTRAGAEPLAENALRIRKVDRAFGKRPGAAALDETAGVRPGTVAESAQSRLNELTPQVDAAAAASQDPFSLAPARAEVQGASAKALGRNEAKTVEQLKPLQAHLATDLATGEALPSEVPMSRGLELQRGFGAEHVHNWNPETLHGVKGTAARVYHTLGEEFPPEIQALRGREAGLIPVTQRGASTDLNAGLGQRVLGRIGAHTGALTGAALGAHFGGLPGGLAGLVIPEIAASPTVQMIGARGLNAGANVLKSPITKYGAKVAPALTRQREER